jgi:hypothetical protein
VLALFERIYALVQSFHNILLSEIVFMHVNLFHMALQRCASFGHG